jgi:hypothetical protein
VSRRVRGLLVGALLGALACASPIQTVHDSDPDVDFSRYRSYAWLRQDSQEPGGAALQSPYVSALDDRRFRAAVDAELAAKGYLKESSFDEADLVVTYKVGRQEKVQVRQTPGRDTVYVSPYGHGPWYGSSPVSVSTYTEGTLIIEFYDRSTHQAVWVGQAIKRLSQNDDRESLIRRAAAAILEPFPARPPS